MVSLISHSSILKHSAAVQISNAISASQRKVWNVLLAFAHNELLTKEEHTISLRMLAIMLDYPRHSYERLKVDLVALVETVVEWNIVDRQWQTQTPGDSLSLQEGSIAEQWTVCSLLAGATIVGGTVYYSFYPRLRQLLYRPATFARIDLLKQAQLRSKHALALYELCEQYCQNGETPVMAVEVFQHLMGAEGYTSWKDIHRRIIMTAVKEVNTLTRFIIKAEPQKQSGKVTHIKFCIRNKT